MRDLNIPSERHPEKANKFQRDDVRDDRDVADVLWLPAL